MRFSDLRLVRLLRLLHRRGPRNGVDEIVTAFARKHLSVPRDVFEDYRWVLTEEKPVTLRAPQSGPLRINWLLPNISTGGGGLFNIFRTIQQLEAWGHLNRVYVAGKAEHSPAMATQLVRKSYFPINAEVEALSDKIPDSDALIATSWPTAYAARGVGNTAQKFYFVQDLEYLFYAPGSLHEFARQTYQFGFRGITAGPWIADVLRRDFGMECSVFGFSYDRQAYGSTGSRRLAPGKKRVLFYARPQTERRGFELGILALSLVASKLPDVEFVLVGFPPQSIRLPFPAVFPGVLPLSELGALYRSCDVALVLSHTNLSLLPLELMACGCAIVSNRGPNTEWLLTDSTAQLANADPRSLASAIIEILETDSLRLQKVKAALDFVQSTDWTKENKAIEAALFAQIRNPHQQTQHV
jgi:glycosyltransferase involved in cell wall biosynthesis